MCGRVSASESIFLFLFCLEKIFFLEIAKPCMLRPKLENFFFALLLQRNRIEECFMMVITSRK